MKAYTPPMTEVINLNSSSTILAGSYKTLKGGGSNAGQKNPVAESNQRIPGFDDDELDNW